MKKLVLSNSNNGYTSVADVFIENYVPSSNGEFVKIYLYLLYLSGKSATNVSIAGLADTFNQTENDILRALRYWDKLGVITLSGDDNGSEPSGICINSLTDSHNAISEATIPNNNPETTTASDTAVTFNTVHGTEITGIISTGGNAYTTSATDSSGIIPVFNITHIEPSKVQYPSEKLKELGSNEDFSMLLFALQTYLGRPLSDKETNAVIYFYDTLDFSTELIEYLFQYCISKGKTAIRYIEKVALSWAEQGISTIKAAKEETVNHNGAIYAVMKAFGLNNREPGTYEKELITKWTDSYCFDTDMIIEACSRTLQNTHQPSFEYADSILTNWNSANVRTTADIKKSDATFNAVKTARKQAPVNNTASINSTAANRFNNFHQRDKHAKDWDSSLLSNNV